MLKFIRGFKISNYKSIGEEYVGIDDLANLNIIIGQNNIGKSSLLEIFEILNDEEQKKENNSTKLRVKVRITEEFVTEYFFGGSSHTNPEDYYDYGKKFIDSIALVETDIAINSITIISLDKGSMENNDNDLNNTTLKILLRELLLGQYPRDIRKLLADRDLRPENSKINYIRPVDSNGVGATSVVENFINNSDWDNNLVEKEILKDLNEIIKPADKFTRIGVQRIKDDIWEIFLDDLDNNRISISNSGSGLKTVILVLIKIYLEPHLKEANRIHEVFIFEELENNLHPSTFRRLLRFIENWTVENNKIVFLTTHSHIPINMFVNNQNTSLTHLFKENRIVNSRTVLDRNTTNHLLIDLAIQASDILQSNSVIWVEGPTDRLYLKKLIDLYSEASLVENLHYQFLYYGGRLLSHYTAADKNIEDDLIEILTVNRNSIVVMDSDKASAESEIGSTKVRIITEIDINGGINWVTEGREIENYLPDEVINEFFEVDGSLEKYERIEDYLDNLQDNLGNRYKNNKVKNAREISELISHENKMDMKYDFEDKVKEIINKIKSWNAL